MESLWPHTGSGRRRPPGSAHNMCWPAAVRCSRGALLQAGGWKQRRVAGLVGAHARCHWVLATMPLAAADQHRQEGKGSQKESAHRSVGRQCQPGPRGCWGTAAPGEQSRHGAEQISAPDAAPTRHCRVIQHSLRLAAALSMRSPAGRNMALSRRQQSFGRTAWSITHALAVPTATSDQHICWGCSAHAMAVRRPVVVKGTHFPSMPRKVLAMGQGPE